MFFGNLWLSGVGKFCTWRQKMKIFRILSFFLKKSEIPIDIEIVYYCGSSGYPVLINFARA